MAVAASGCGDSNPNNPSGNPGKQLFAQKCGSCHVLEAAGTRGVAGPNLDAAFKQSLADGFERSTIESVVRKQIALPMGKAMPANLVEGKDADAVAAYVAESVKDPSGSEDGAASAGR